MGELTIEDFFLLLKPLCDSFMKEPTADKAVAFAKLVDRAPNSLVQKLSEHLLYPMTHHLKKSTLG